MKPTLIASEWSSGNVSVYDVDGNGDPIAATRRPFIDKFPGPEGAFFDPVSGDFLFSTFDAADPNLSPQTQHTTPERLLVVEGFSAPPPPPPPPPTK